MSAHLRALPNPSTEAMALLGETTIVDVLGSHAHLLAEKERLFAELRQEGVDVAAVTARDRGKFQAWLANDRRLRLYDLLNNELDPLP